MKTAVLSLVDLLSSGVADPITSALLYEETVIELGGRYDFLTRLNIVSLAAGDGTFDLPDDAIRPLGIFYDDRQLSVESLNTLERIAGRDWRTQLGLPMAVTQEQENTRTFRVWPKPVAASEPYTATFGMPPMGKDYPENSIAMAYTDVRDDIPIYLVLPVALLVIAKEFNRESDHRDTDFAALAAVLGTILIDMLE